MQRRLTVIGRLLNHWGIGWVCGSIYTIEKVTSTGIGIGIIMIVIGNILVGLFEVPYYKKN